MAYRRSYGYRKRFRRGRGRKRRRSGRYRRAGYYGRYKKSGVSSCNSAVEKKFHDFNVATAAAATWTAFTQFNLIAQGVTESQRVGRKCCIHSVAWKGTVIWAPHAGSTLSVANALQVYVFLDTQTNGAAAVEADMFTVATIPMDSWRNLAQQERFKMLYKKRYYFNRTAAAGDGAVNDTMEVMRNFSGYLKCQIPIEFDASVGAITEIRSNNIFMVYCSRNVTETVTPNFRVRVRFHD